MKTVGLVFTKKKMERSGFLGLSDYALQHGLHIVHIDLDSPIEKVAPSLDIIVHKMTDTVAKMERGVPGAQEQYDRFQSYCQSHPDVVILDDWNSIHRLLDRKRLYDRLKTCSRPDLFLFPTTIALESVKSPVSSVDQLQFPVICKRRSACSSTEAHQMTVIPTLADLHHIQGYGDTEPVILQDFIPHDGVIVKVYVIDGKMHISTRPSFKNTCTDSGVLIHFDSQQLPKTFADEPPNDISKDLQQCLLTQDKNHMHEIKEQALDYERLQKITDCLWENLGLTFFGYDILLKSESNEYYICDVNYFPSFKNVPNFHCLFIQVLKNRLGM